MTQRSFPSIDLSSFDLSKIKLPQLPGVEADKVVTAVRDALRDSAYITIGFGVLAVQQAQVRRREMVATLSERFGTSKTQMDQIVSSVEARLSQLDERFEALESKLDSAVGKLEERLPDQAGALLGQAHDIAKAARKQVRGLISSAA